MSLTNHGGSFRAAKTPSPGEASGDGTVRVPESSPRFTCLLRRQKWSQRDNFHQPVVSERHNPTRNQSGLSANSICLAATVRQGFSFSMTHGPAMRNNWRVSYFAVLSRSRGGRARHSVRAAACQRSLAGSPRRRARSDAPYQLLVHRDPWPCPKFSTARTLFKSPSRAESLRPWE